MITKDKINKGFFVVFAAFVVLFVVCIYFILKIQYIEGETWKSIGQTIKSISKPRKIEPLRGNIYCYNSEGEKEILAASMKTYKIYFSGEQLRLIEKDLKEKNKKFSRTDSIDKLAKQLSDFTKEAHSGYYRGVINKAYNTKSRVLLINRSIDYVERKAVARFTLLNSANGKYNDCMISEEKNRRIHPYNNLALRTVGEVFGDKRQKREGRFGIELQFDSILRGKEGLNDVLRISRRKTVFDEEQKAINGADITLTLNIDMQDIVQSCLKAQAERLGIERGCAILMEVETGEIKAISNLYYSSNGYFEGGNMAISDMNPPGSTFKTLSMLVALENDIITPNTIVDAYNKRYPKVTDHAPQASWSAITASDVLVFSSNVGTSNIIGEAFDGNPMRFIKEIHKTKVTEHFDIQLPGATDVKLGSMKYWSVRDTISRADLPTLSFGYQSAFPPIYMLRFYNAIANGGKMINPFVVKEIDNNGKITKYSAETVNRSIASAKTIKELQKMLQDVVEKKGGTAYAYRSGLVSFAGKTGTAYFTAQGITTDQVSFCGYFPADKPKYSCIVVMQRKGIWGSQSCEVFKNIAEKIIALNKKTRIKELQDSIKYLPVVKNGNANAIDYVLDKLNVKADIKDFQWVITERDSTRILTDKLPIIQNLVPSVVGMGAKDATYLLESCGLRVQIYGFGTVKKQSLAAGVRVNKGQTIILYLD